MVKKLEGFLKVRFSTKDARIELLLFLGLLLGFAAVALGLGWLSDVNAVLGRCLVISGAVIIGLVCSYMFWTMACCVSGAESEAESDELAEDFDACAMSGDFNFSLSASDVQGLILACDTAADEACSDDDAEYFQGLAEKLRSCTGVDWC